MGYFEDHLAALGRAMDDGVATTRSRVLDLSDRRGWGLFLSRARDRARESREDVSRSARDAWRRLGERAQRGVVLGGVATLVVLAIIGARAIAGEGETPGLTAQEMATLVALRGDGPRMEQWVQGSGGAAQPGSMLSPGGR